MLPRFLCFRTEPDFDSVAGLHSSLAYEHDLWHDKQKYCTQTFSLAWFLFRNSILFKSREKKWPIGFFSSKGDFHEKQKLEKRRVFPCKGFSFFSHNGWFPLDWWCLNNVENDVVLSSSFMMWNVNPDRFVNDYIYAFRAY